MCGPSDKTYTVLPSKPGLFRQLQGWWKVVSWQELDVPLQLSTLSVGLLLQLREVNRQSTQTEARGELQGHNSRHTSHSVAGIQ